MDLRSKCNLRICYQKTSRTMHTEQYQTVFRATECLSLFSSNQCIIKYLLDSIFVIPGRDNQGLGRYNQKRACYRIVRGRMMCIPNCQYFQSEINLRTAFSSRSSPLGTFSRKTKRPQRRGANSDGRLRRLNRN